jgi:Integrase zinc binding domain
MARDGAYIKLTLKIPGGTLDHYLHTHTYIIDSSQGRVTVCLSSLLVIRNYPYHLAPTVGLEPTTTKLTTCFTPIWKYLTIGILPSNALLARKFRRISLMYAILNGQLYKREYLRPWLKCIREEKAKELLAEIHEGIYGSHQGAKTLAKCILRACYYWPTIHQDVTYLVRRFEKYQFNSRLTHVPPAEMITIAGAWSFDL